MLELDVASAVDGSLAVGDAVDVFITVDGALPELSELFVAGLDDAEAAAFVLLTISAPEIGGLWLLEINVVPDVEEFDVLSCADF